MHHFIRPLGYLATAAALVLAVSNGHADQSSSQASSPGLTVMAASSLEAALRPIGESFEASTGVPVTFEFGPSGELAEKVEAGAVTDVFVAASPTDMARLAALGFTRPTETVTVAGDRLVLFVPLDNPAALAGPKDLKNASSIVTGDPQIEPDGTSAREWLHDIGLWPDLKDRLVFAGSPAEVIAATGDGQADAGIGFASETLESSVTVVFVVPDDRITRIRYVAAPIATGLHQDLARQFIAYLLSPENQAIIQANGLVTASGQ